MMSENMKKSCKYCGKIHDVDYICDKKPKSKNKRDRQFSDFRSGSDWKQKREHIKIRDNFACVACLRQLPGTLKRVNTENLSVHHITPLNKNFSMRLDDKNLITLCDFHHEMAEKGEISADVLRGLIPPGV